MKEGSHCTQYMSSPNREGEDCRGHLCSCSSTWLCCECILTKRPQHFCILICFSVPPDGKHILPLNRNLCSASPAEFAPKAVSGVRCTFSSCFNKLNTKLPQILYSCMYVSLLLSQPFRGKFSSLTQYAYTQSLLNI